MHVTEPVCTDVVGPLAQGTIDLCVGSEDDPVGARCQPYEPGTSIGRVGHPFDVPGGLELLDEEPGALLGHAGLLGEVGDAGSVRADASRDPGLRGGDVGDAGRDDGVVCSLLEGAVGDEQQDAEVGLLTRGGHSARLDR